MIAFGLSFGEKEQQMSSSRIRNLEMQMGEKKKKVNRAGWLDYKEGDSVGRVFNGISNEVMIAVERQQS